MSDVKEVLFAMLVVSGVLALAGVLASGADPPAGLSWQSGDRPREAPAAGCPRTAGCPARLLSWTIPPGRTISARFTAGVAGPVRATGRIALLGPSCPAVVDWTVSTGGHTLVARTLRSGPRSDQPVEAGPIPGNRPLTLTAHRTDGGSCPAILQWSAPRAVPG